MSSAEPLVLPAQEASRWPELGVWNFYFLLKFLLLWQGLLNFQVLPNLVFAAVLLVPLQSAWARWLRNLLALPVAVALLYQDTWLPPFSRLLERPEVLQLSGDYLLELAGRTLDWHLLGACLVLLVAYRLLAPWLRLTTLSVAGLLWLAVAQGVPELAPPAAPLQGQASSAGAAPVAQPEGPASSAALNAYLERFYRDEQARRTAFPAEPSAAAPAFDLLVVNICSLAWSDLDATSLRDHPLWRRMDVVFDRFNSATAYSGPAAIRLLRASCGQSAHAGLYETPDNQCLLFDNLARLGFAGSLLLNHDGRFDGFLQEVRNEGRLPAPLVELGQLRHDLVGFDGSPIWRDREVLGRWWQQRQAGGEARVALFYNSITLHDGNRQRLPDGRTRSADYHSRAQVLLDDLNAFVEQLQASGRPVLLALVPEHGASLDGDRMQIAGMREIPTPAITHVPVALKLINMPGAERSEPLHVAEPSSYLALSELVARLYAGTAQGEQGFDWGALLADLPQTPMVSENSGTVVLDYQGATYVRIKERSEWLPYPPNKP